jgi:hypothetical protein
VTLRAPDVINAMKSKVQDLTDQINVAGLDTRYALVTFKDSASVKTNWTSDPEGFKNSVNALEAKLGDDEPEDALDAIENVISMGFRPDAQKVILVITDAHAHYNGDGTTYSEYTKAEVIKNLVFVIPIYSGLIDCDWARSSQEATFERTEHGLAQVDKTLVSIGDPAFLAHM